MNLQNPKTGDVLLCHGHSLWSRLIEWVTRSPYSHVAMVVVPDPAESGPLVFEAIEHYGVRNTQLSDWEYRGVVKHARFAHLPDPAAVTRWWFQNLSKPYAWGDIASILAFKIFRFDIRRNPHGYICSKAVEEAVVSGGLASWQQPTYEVYPTPGDIAQCCGLQILHG